MKSLKERKADAKAKKATRDALKAAEKAAAVAAKASKKADKEKSESVAADATLEQANATAADTKEKVINNIIDSLK